MTKRLAVVTGGAGFIGTNLATELRNRGWSTIAFDNGSTGNLEDAAKVFDEVIEGDILDAERVASVVRRARVIVHLAAQSGVPVSVADPWRDHEINVRGTLQMLLAARDAGIAGFVFASSNAPLGAAPVPSHEGVVPRPLSPYGASKLAGEAYCSAFAASYGLRTVALRFANVYGPLSYHKGSVIASFMRAATEGAPLLIDGDGRQTRDFVYVGDVCSGIAAAAESDLLGELLHLGSGTETSITDVAATLVSMFVDRDLEIEHGPPRVGDVRSSRSDITRAHRMLGYTPSVDLTDGLALTRDWFLAQQHL